MELVIIGRDGADATRSALRLGQVVSIGRSPDCDLIIANKYVSRKHAQLIASDPREGAGLLKRLKERSGSVGAEAAADVEDILRIGGGEEEEEETDALLRWAYAEADAMLRENRGIVQELTERLAGGAATIGDCVAVIEGW